MKKNKKKETIKEELLTIKNRETAIKTELDEIKKKENILINEINKDLNKDEAKSRQAYLEVMHFTFNDFAQVVIGACVFTFAPFLDTDPWNYLPIMNTSFLFLLHLFFLGCSMIAINYQFRDNMKLDMWFMKLLVKRMFYVYFTVFMVMCLVLTMLGRLNYDMLLIDGFRNFILIQTVGIFGAMTFSFIKR